MAGYIPANTYITDYDENGLQLRQLYSSPETLYSEFGASESTVYSASMRLPGDEESLLKGRSRAYASPLGTPVFNHSPPSSPEFSRGRQRLGSASFRPDGHDLRYEHRTNSQFRKLLGWVLFRLFLSCTLVAGLIAMIGYYSAKKEKILDTTEKYIFNTLNITLPLLLSLNSVVCIQS
jgi:hypothetical protein